MWKEHGGNSWGVRGRERSQHGEKGYHMAKGRWEKIWEGGGGQGKKEQEDGHLHTGVDDNLLEAQLRIVEACSPPTPGCAPAGIKVRETPHSTTQHSILTFESLHVGHRCACVCLSVCKYQEEGGRKEVGKGSDRVRIGLCMEREGERGGYYLTLKDNG